MVNKRVQNAVLGCNLKNDRMISVHFQGKPFDITVIQVYAPTSNAEEDERFYEDLQDLLELTPKKKISFSSSVTSVQFSCSVMSDSLQPHELQHARPPCPSPSHRGLEFKSRKSRDTWSNRQIWSTEWSWAKANRILPRECTGHSRYPLPTTREDSTCGHHQIVNTEIRLIIFFAAKDGEALHSQQKQDRELTVEQIMNSWLPNSGLNWRK